MKNIAFENKYTVKLSKNEKRGCWLQTSTIQKHKHRYVCVCIFLSRGQHLISVCMKSNGGHLVKAEADWRCGTNPGKLRYTETELKDVSVAE